MGQELWWRAGGNLTMDMEKENRLGSGERTRFHSLVTNEADPVSSANEEADPIPPANDETDSVPSANDETDPVPPANEEADLVPPTTDDAAPVPHATDKTDLILPANDETEPTILSPVVANHSSPADQAGELVLPTVMAFQSLLNQFSHPKVRTDFRDGRFGVRINPSLLPKIDELRWLLFPAWSGKGMNENITRNICAARRIQLLLTRSEEVCELSCEVDDESLSYHEWYALLELIASSKYWESLAAQQRCLNIPSDDRSCDSGNGSGGLLQKKKDAIASCGRPLDKSAG